MSTPCSSHELLTYFMETACVEVEPENTRLYRTVLLRILYSVGSVDIQACVATLLENGIFLGSYDRAATVQSLYDKITVMHIPDWVYLMRFVRVESVDGIFHALQEVYQDSIAESPLWKLKTTFEVRACVCAARRRRVCVGGFFGGVGKRGGGAATECAGAGPHTRRKTPWTFPRRRA